MFRRDVLILALATTALCSIARAQEVTSTGRVESHPVGRPTEAIDEIIVTGSRKFGTGLMVQETAASQVDIVSSAYIQKNATANNPVQLLKLAPGANVATSDPYGITNNNISIRGLNQDEIGFTFEGIPINDPGTSAIFINGYTDTENLQQIELQPGSADLDTPTISASAGAVNIYYRDPSMTSGGLVDYAHGSYDMNRIFLRGDTGVIGNTGIRAFGSYSYTDTAVWRGAGRSKRWHYDIKAVKDFDNGSRTELFVTFNQLFGGNPYRSPNLAQWQQQGNNFNYDSTFTTGDNLYYKLQTNPYNNLLISAPSTFNVGKQLALNVTPYFYLGFGGTPGAVLLRETSTIYNGNVGYSLDLNGNGTKTDSVLAYDPFYNKEARSGVVAKANYQNSFNNFILGYWFEYSNDQQFQRFELANADGSVGDYYVQSNLIRLPDGTALASQNQVTKTTINSVFAGDTLTFGKVAIDLGVKELWVTRDGENYIPGTIRNPSLSATTTLPRAAVRWRPDDHQQFYASVSTNTREPVNNVLFQSYGLTTGALTGVTNTALKPEYSVSEEIGWRYNNSLINATVALFNYSFTHHQVASTVVQNGATYSAYVDAGNMTGRGVDVKVGFRPVYGFSPVFAAEYLHATTDSNLQRGVDYLPTAGKIAPRAPSWLFSTGLNYEHGDFFGLVSAKYIDSTYSTFMNDESIPAHTQVDLAVGYRLPSFWAVKKPEIRLNIINLSDGKYLTGINSVTGNAKSTIGIRGTTIAAALPTYFTETPVAATVTLSLPF